jgi:hypothetical protein
MTDTYNRATADEKTATMKDFFADYFCGKVGVN